MSEENYQEYIIDEFEKSLKNEELQKKNQYVMFSKPYTNQYDSRKWVKENNKKFLDDTTNCFLNHRWYYSEMGPIMCLEYSPDGSHIVVGHATGVIQLRHGKNGTVLCTLRNIQFPPKPIYTLQYSRDEERVCYAVCADGIIYRIEIPAVFPHHPELPDRCVKADPALECLSMQFYGAPGTTSYCSPFFGQRIPPLSLGLTNQTNKMVIGFADNGIKVIDMETKEVEQTYKIHKMRLQFVPPKLRRVHCGQVCALRCHKDKPNIFASAAWDNTLKIWDLRCSLGCMMTFEVVNICGDSIDLNRNHCVAGSWQPTDGLTVWDLVARKRLSAVRVQNRRPDVDGEYYYACRYWNSDKFNRKGKYAIVGGSGTNAVEVINLHNRYIACSYPCDGTVVALTSHQEYIAFGGTAPVFTIVAFHDPKHEGYPKTEDEVAKSVYTYDWSEYPPSTDSNITE